MTAAREYFKNAGRGSINRCAIDTGYSFASIRMAIARNRKCSVIMARSICDWTNNALSITDFLTCLDDIGKMKAAKKHFKTLGYGAIKKCSIDTGFSQAHLDDVINLRRKCSLFVAKCIITWTNGALKTNDFLIGKGGNV
jgi:hypothetical protein